MLRIVHYFLCGEPVGTGYCSEDCDDCHVRFECYTTRKGVLHSYYPMAKDIYSIQPYEFALGHFKVMRCPHCLKMFKVSTTQLEQNTKFKCKVCGMYNQGSSRADKWGVLIGEY